MKNINFGEYLTTKYSDLETDETINWINIYHNNKYYCYFRTKDKFGGTSVLASDKIYFDNINDFIEFSCENNDQLYNLKYRFLI